MKGYTRDYCSEEKLNPCRCLKRLPRIHWHLNMFTCIAMWLHLPKGRGRGAQGKDNRKPENKIESVVILEVCDCSVLSATMALLRRFVVNASAWKRYYNGAPLCKWKAMNLIWQHVSFPFFYCNQIDIDALQFKIQYFCKSIGLYKNEQL